MKVRPRLIIRSVLLGIVSVGGAAGVESACSSPPMPRYFDGANLGYCSGFQVDEIAGGDCGCSGSVAYALCNGSSYTECACEIPSGYFVDGGAIDTGQGAQVNRTLPFNGGGPQGVSLPCCEGNDVFEIPANECAGANCAGTVAYAVCQNNSYSACACDIPSGYGYPDGPGPCDEN